MIKIPGKCKKVPVVEKELMRDMWLVPTLFAKGPKFTDRLSKERQELRSNGRQRCLTYVADRFSEVKQKLRVN